MRAGLKQCVGQALVWPGYVCMGFWPQYRGRLAELLQHKRSVIRRAHDIVGKQSSLFGHKRAGMAPSGTSPWALASGLSLIDYYDCRGWLTTGVIPARIFFRRLVVKTTYRFPALQWWKEAFLEAKPALEAGGVTSLCPPTVFVREVRFGPDAWA